MEKYTTSIEIEAPKTDEEAIAESRKKSFEEDEYAEIRVHKKKERPEIGFYVLNILLGMVIIIIALGISVRFFCSLNNVDYEGVQYSDAKAIHEELFAPKYCSNAIIAWGYNLIHKPGHLPFVKSVNVYLKDKNSVVVSVTEDELSGVFKAGGQYVYFNLDGEVVEISKKEIDKIPQITGITLTESEEGSPLNISNSQKNIILSLLKYLKEGNIFPEIIEFEKDGSFGFYTESIFVDMGVSTDVREKCARLPRILPNLEGEAGTLHLEEWGRENSDIIFEKSI